VSLVEADSEAEPQALEAQLERLRDERDALRARLTDAEQLLAEMPSLRASREELERVHSTRSWRATAPLRRLEGAVRRDALPAVRSAAKGALLRTAARLRRGAGAGT
jgi:hypothetical protein